MLIRKFHLRHLHFQEGDKNMSIYPTIISKDRVILTDVRGQGSIEASRTGQNYSVTFRCNGRITTFTADSRFMV